LPVLSVGLDTVFAGEAATAGDEEHRERCDKKNS